MRRAVRLLVPPAVAAVLAVVAWLPQGDNPGAGHMTFDPTTDEYEFVHTWNAVNTTGIGLGIASAYLLLAAPLLAYRYPLGWLLSTRRRRQVHLWVGVAILVLAAGHAAILPLVGFYRGWLSGVLALILLIVHGVSGVLKHRLIRSWGAERWRYWHVATSWAALVYALFHSFGAGIIAHEGP